jgi:hypothetical protein
VQHRLQKRTWCGRDRILRASLKSLLIPNNGTCIRTGPSRRLKNCEHDAFLLRAIFYRLFVATSAVSLSFPTFPCLPVPRSCVHNSRCTRHWPWRSRSSILDAYASASLHRSHPHAASVRCASTLSPKPEVYVCVSGQRDPSTKRASRSAATEFAGWPRLAYSGHVLTFFAASS